LFCRFSSRAIRIGTCGTSNYPHNYQQPKHHQNAFEILHLPCNNTGNLSVYQYSWQAPSTQRSTDAGTLRALTSNTLHQQDSSPTSIALLLLSLICLRRWLYDGLIPSSTISPCPSHVPPPAGELLTFARFIPYYSHRYLSPYIWIRVNLVFLEVDTTSLGGYMSSLGTCSGNVAWERGFGDAAERLILVMHPCSQYPSA
jgi:hypothetical protein